jgi:hypothetical protein
MPNKEKDLIKISGTRIVPGFVFKDKSLFGFTKKPKVIIGFESNIDEIKEMLHISS